MQPGFVAQTGDPTGKGRGGESIFAQLYGEQVYFNHGVITLVTTPILGEIFRKRGDPADQAHETWPRVNGQLRHCG